MVKKTNVLNIFLLLILFGASPQFSGFLYAETIDPQSLFESALHNSPELQKLEIEKRQSVIDKKNAEASRLPSIDFQTTMTWMSNPAIEPITLTAGELGSYDIGGSSLLLPAEDMVIYKGMEDTHYDFKFIVDQPVFTWGKLKNAIELYGHISDVSDFILQSKRNEIKTRIFIYYYSLYFIAEIEKTLTLQHEDAERMINIAEESFNNGFILYTELLKAKIQLKELTIAEAELREQKELALLGLSRLSGMNRLSTEDLEFGSIVNIEEIKLSKEDDYISKAYIGSPEIKMLEILENINALRVDISKGSGDFKPDIGLHLELGYSGPRFPFIEADWFGQDSLELTSTIAIQTKVFEGGKQKLQIERDLEELEKAYYEYESGTESIVNIISESILKLDLNKQNIEYYRLLQENDLQQLKMKQTQFDAGSGSEVDMLEEKINFNIHRINEYRESIDFYKNYFTLLNVSASID